MVLNLITSLFGDWIAGPLSVEQLFINCDESVAKLFFFSHDFLESFLDVYELKTW